MPNLAIISLLAIFIAIIVGFYKKTNVGIIMVAFAFILSPPTTFQRQSYSKVLAFLYF